MAWFADLAGKAETLLNNLDEQTGAALRHHNVTRKKVENNGTDFGAPEAAWLPKKRPATRSMKKAMPIPDTTKVYPPSRKGSPVSSTYTRPQVKDFSDSPRNGSNKSKSKKTASKRVNPGRPHNLDHCPKTLVCDDRDGEVYTEHLGLQLRRMSLPSDLELITSEEFTIRMQNLEVENAMLKNELNVMNREVTELLERLRKTEDGNDLDSAEVSAAGVKQKATEILNKQLNLEKQSLTSKLEQVSVKIQENKAAEVTKYTEINQRLEGEISTLQNRNSELEEKCKILTESSKINESARNKLENDLRHAQSTVSDLQGDLQKTTDECRRLERDWEAYKLRVKNMLQAKDNEIQNLQDGVNTTEDAKELMEQMEQVKQERDELQEVVANVRVEWAELKLYVQQVETRQNTAERVVTALRDALREERACRNKAEADYHALAKEMKALQMDTCQTIASLRTALREKEHELHHIRDVSSAAPTADPSALNVADYDTIDNNKIHHLTQILVQKQTKIDNLLADNNMLRIQLEKFESKFKTEVTSNRTKFSHSVVHLQESDNRRSRPYNTPSTLSTLSLRLGIMVKRYPVLRMFVIGYMVCLHFWVLTVLFTSTPENYVPPSKS